jgi:hypothetical protein
MKRLLLASLLIFAFPQTHTFPALDTNNAFTGTNSFPNGTPNPAMKPLTNDIVRYVSNNGSDSNDGLSWGTAKLTISGACSSITSQNSTCTGTGFGTIFIAPSYSGAIPACGPFGYTPTCSVNLSFIGDGYMVSNSNISSWGTFILLTTNSSYTWNQDGFLMFLESGGPRPAGAIKANSVFLLPDLAQGTSTPASGEMASFVGAGVNPNHNICSSGVNTSPSGGLLIDCNPTVLLKTGSGSANYTGANTSFSAVDTTNLCYSVTVPTGWKLSIVASGNMDTATAIAQAEVALADAGATCTTGGTTPLAGTGRAVTAVAIGAGSEVFTTQYVLTGDGNSHSILLVALTTNASDSWQIVNVSTALAPSMTFTLMPSN